MHEIQTFNHRRKRKRRIRKGARRCQRVFKPKEAFIEQRPDIVEKGRRVGDWESDSVESRENKPGINTLVERQTGMVFISKLNDKTSRSTTTAIVKKLEYLYLKARQTITFFCNPYHLWER